MIVDPMLFSSKGNGREVCQMDNRLGCSSQPVEIHYSLSGHCHFVARRELKQGLLESTISNISLTVPLLYPRIYQYIAKDELVALKRIVSLVFSKAHTTFSAVLFIP